MRCPHLALSEVPLLLLVLVRVQGPQEAQHTDHLHQRERERERESHTELKGGLTSDLSPDACRLLRLEKGEEDVEEVGVLMVGLYHIPTRREGENTVSPC